MEDRITVVSAIGHHDESILSLEFPQNVILK